MRDILDRVNVTVNRGGFCKCVFHKEDTASMKVYRTGYYCFGCNKGGDIVSFVKDYCGLDFKEACKWISGEELSKQDKEQVTIARMRRNERLKKQKALQAELDKVNSLFSGLWQKILTYDPLSSEWAEAYNKWQQLCYKQEELFNELGAK